MADSDSVRDFAGSLEQHVRRLVFGEVPVSIVSVPKLELKRAGKTRFVVSEYSGGTRRGRTSKASE